MKRMLLAVAVATTVLAAMTSVVTSTGQSRREVVGLTPDQVR